MAGSDPQIFANLTNARRVWAVGAVHADLASLQALHAELAGRMQTGDRLVYLGNIIGRGPSSVDVIDEILTFRRQFLARFGSFVDDHVILRGAQEEMWRKLAQLQFAPAPADVLRWMLDHGVDATLNSYGADADEGLGCCREGAVAITRWTSDLAAKVRQRPGHDDFFAAIRRAAFTSGGEILLTAAGVDPERPVSEQGDSFWWDMGGFSRIHEVWRGYIRLVRGCDAQNHKPEMTEVTATLDGGAGFGGNLHAACFSLDGKPADWIQV
jgi:serine/threonine protein phosphatase 1